MHSHRNIPAEVIQLAQLLNAEIKAAELKVANSSNSLQARFDYNRCKQAYKNIETGSFAISTVDNLTFHFQGPYPCSTYFRPYAFFSRKFETTETGYTTQNQMSQKQLEEFYLNYFEQIKQYKWGACHHFAIAAQHFAKETLTQGNFTNNILVEHVLLNNWIHDLIKITYNNEIFYYDPWFQFHCAFTTEHKVKRLVIPQLDFSDYMIFLINSLANQPKKTWRINHRDTKYCLATRTNSANTDQDFGVQVTHGNTSPAVTPKVRIHEPFFIFSLWGKSLSLTQSLQNSASITCGFYFSYYLLGNAGFNVETPILTFLFTALLGLGIQAFNVSRKFEDDTSHRDLSEEIKAGRVVVLR